jgi:hypothetical protein
MKLSLALSLVCLSTLTVAQPAAPQQEQRDPITSRVPPVDSIEVCVPYSAGWNMVSNPVLRVPGTDSIWQVFCGIRWCIPRGGYLFECRAWNGMGFWLRMPGPAPSVCCITGGDIAQDSIPVVTLWNLIGTISYPVAVSSIYSIPPNLIASRFFGFSSSYVAVDTLRPGFGYWVKMMGPGQLVLQH